MRVLWFSNCVLGNSTSKGSGSWLFAMSKLICGSVDLVNATISNVEKVTFNEYQTFSEVLIPSYKLKDGIPSESDIKTVQETIDKIAPDIIHIWGLESIWGLLYAKGYIKGRVLLEIQGLMEPCYNVFWGGINPIDLTIKSFCVRNIVYPKTTLKKRRESFRINGALANAVISKCSYISTQSNWVREQIQFDVKPGCKIYNTKRPIRQEFWDAKPWESHNGTCRFFTSMSYYLPFKGIHILIKALPLIKKQYNDFVLEIAGVEQKDLTWYRNFSYLKYLITLSKRLGVFENIHFVGRLNAEQIVDHLQKCNVFVNPSFVESYSASTAEALALGVPSVVAYAGAMPAFSEFKQTSLLYSPMDYVACAAKIIDLMVNSELRGVLSKNAKKEIRRICDSSNVRETQLHIYNTMLLENQ